MARILAFAGSTRKNSFNQKLLDAVLLLLDSNKEHQVNHIHLADFEMPLYNGDLEENSGLPENTKKLRQIFLDHDALLIVSPEYNGFFTPLVKNTLDWLSRPSSGEAGLLPFKDKVAFLLSASPGALGGMRSLVALRQLLSNLLVMVHPEQYALSKAHEAFAADGTLKDTQQTEKIRSLLKSWSSTLTQLRGKE